MSHVQKSAASSTLGRWEIVCLSHVPLQDFLHYYVKDDHHLIIASICLLLRPRGDKALMMLVKFQACDQQSSVQIDANVIQINFSTKCRVFNPSNLIADLKKNVLNFVQVAIPQINVSPPPEVERAVRPDMMWSHSFDVFIRLVLKVLGYDRCMISLSLGRVWSRWLRWPSSWWIDAVVGAAPAGCPLVVRLLPGYACMPQDPRGMRVALM